MVKSFLEKLLIGLVLFSLMIVSGTVVLQGMIDSYDLGNTTDELGFNSSYDISSDLYNDVSEIKNETLYPAVEGGDETWQSLVKSSYKSLGLVPKSISLVYQVTKSVSDQMGIPPFFLIFTMIILMISIVFAIIYLIMKA